MELIMEIKNLPKEKWNWIYSCLVSGTPTWDIVGVNGITIDEVRFVIRKLNEKGIEI